MFESIKNSIAELQAELARKQQEQKEKEKQHQIYLKEQEERKKKRKEDRQRLIKMVRPGLTKYIRHREYNLMNISVLFLALPYDTRTYEYDEYGFPLAKEDMHQVYVDSNNRVEYFRYVGDHEFEGLVTGQEIHCTKEYYTKWDRYDTWSNNALITLEQIYNEYGEDNVCINTLPDKEDWFP